MDVFCLRKNVFTYEGQKPQTWFELRLKQRLVQSTLADGVVDSAALFLGITRIIRRRLKFLLVSVATDRADDQNHPGQYAEDDPNPGS